MKEEVTSGSLWGGSMREGGRREREREDVAAFADRNTFSHQPEEKQEQRRRLQETWSFWNFILKFCKKNKKKTTSLQLN